MIKGTVQIYSGEGSGKSSAALGKAIKAAELGQRVVIIQFLKGIGDSELVKRLEPEIKVFRFEKSDRNFLDLTEEEQKEEIRNINNGVNYARKVLTTGECDLLVLDELLGLVDTGIIGSEDVKRLLEARNDEQSIILTGIQLNDDTCVLADEVYTIEPVRFKVYE